LAGHVLYSLVGIGFVIAKSILLFNTIKYIGAAYLIYIGYKSLRAKPHSAQNGTVEKSGHSISNHQAIKVGFLTNALNPKATVFFLSLFTQVVSPTTPFAIQALYGLEIMVIALVWFTILSITLTHSGIKSRIVGAQHYVERVMGAVLIVLGVRVALSSSK
jgi:threonine/homoserine/homoserine lactone efflux protein